MKLSQNDKVSGTYTNGISTWEISGRITGISNDTAGGGFGLGRIELDTPISDPWGGERTSLLIDLAGRHEVADSRYNLT